MKLTITIEMDNAAFESGNGAEVCHAFCAGCMDANGNKVGTVEVYE